MKQFIFFGIFMAFLNACKPSPQQIYYGSDACHYCSMTIVDKQHASQIVTKKGKAFKYDAIECMLNSFSENFNEDEIAFYLVANFNEPGKLIDAIPAHYLVSDQIQSPMGANLSAFENEKAAQTATEKYAGQLFSWEEIRRHIVK